MNLSWRACNGERACTTKGYLCNPKDQRVPHHERADEADVVTCTSKSTQASSKYFTFKRAQIISILCNLSAVNVLTVLARVPEQHQVVSKGSTSTTLAGWVLVVVQIAASSRGSCLLARLFPAVVLHHAISHCTLSMPAPHPHRQQLAAAVGVALSGCTGYQVPGMRFAPKPRPAECYDAPPATTAASGARALLRCSGSLSVIGPRAVSRQHVSQPTIGNQRKCHAASGTHSHGEGSPFTALVTTGALQRRA